MLTVEAGNNYSSRTDLVPLDHGPGGEPFALYCTANSR
jgi:hypothetical protein